MAGPRDREMGEESPSGQHDAPGENCSVLGAEFSAQWLAASLEEYKAIRAERLLIQSRLNVGSCR